MDSQEKNNSEYEITQQVVYPMQGVGAIEEIVSREFKGEPTPYYVIYLPSTDMTVMVPCANVDLLGIRAIVTPEVAQAAIDRLDQPLETPDSTDWKQRYQNNMDLAKNGSISSIATVVSSLYTRSKQRELPILERKLYDTVKRLFIDELSLSLKKTKEDIEELVLFQLEQVIDKLNINIKPSTPAFSIDIMDAEERLDDKNDAEDE